MTDKDPHLPKAGKCGAPGEEDAYQVFMDLASGRVNEEELGSWIGANSE